MSKRKITFEENNAIHYFPDEVEYGTWEQKRAYRARAAKRWARAMIEAEKYAAAHATKPIKPKPGEAEV